MPDPEAAAMAAEAAEVSSGPPLSATSDGATEKAGPALSEEINLVDRDASGRFVRKTAAEAAPVDNTQAGDDTGEAALETKGEKTGDAPSTDQTPEQRAAWFRMRNEARAATRQAAETAEQNRQLAERLAALEAAQPKREDPRPQRDAFNDPDAYDTALIDWSGRQAAAKATAEAQAQRATETRQAQAKALADAWTDAKSAFIADHPDYEEVAEAVDENGKDLVPVSIPMAHAIMTAGKDGPAISYWLGQNREDSVRISRLPPVQAIIEIGKIAANLNAPVRRTPKPDPIRPLGSRNTGGSKSLDEMSMDEYAAANSHRLPYGPKLVARTN